MDCLKYKGIGRFPCLGFDRAYFINSLEHFRKESSCKWDNEIKSPNATLFKVE